MYERNKVYISNKCTFIYFSNLLDYFFIGKDFLKQNIFELFIIFNMLNEISYEYVEILKDNIYWNYTK